MTKSYQISWIWDPTEPEVVGTIPLSTGALQWRGNEREFVSNHQLHECLLNRLFRRRSKKTSKLRVTGLCEGNSPVTSEFPAQSTSNAEYASIWWRHHGRLNAKKNSFKLRVTGQRNKLPESVVSTKSINSFKARLDKYWIDSQSMLDPDTSIHELTSARSSNTSKANTPLQSCEWGRSDARGLTLSLSIKGYYLLAPGNPTSVVPIQKSFGSSERDWKPGEKLPIPCKFSTYRFIGYSTTCYGKIRIDPLMANKRDPDFFASPVVNAAWFVVVRPCYLNKDLLSGPKGN